MAEILETGEVDIQDPTRGVCFGSKCQDMSWLVNAVIGRDYLGVLSDQRPQIVRDETDFAVRECLRLGYCLARNKRLADEGTQNA